MSRPLTALLHVGPIFLAEDLDHPEVGASETYLMSRMASPFGISSDEPPECSSDRRTLWHAELLRSCDRAERARWLKQR